MMIYLLRPNRLVIEAENEGDRQLLPILYPAILDTLNTLSKITIASIGHPSPPGRPRGFNEPSVSE
jgi:hypothetical protein